MESVEMITQQEDIIMYETCPCSTNAVHTAWNCPICNGKGFVEKSSQKISSAIQNLRQSWMEDRDRLLNDPDIILTLKKESHLRRSSDGIILNLRQKQ